jgi:hypothetical protein
MVVMSLNEIDGTKMIRKIRNKRAKDACTGIMATHVFRNKVGSDYRQGNRRYFLSNMGVIICGRNDLQ